ncbi:hypothetical protein [Desulfofarcimen acetoxidans]|uniref:hypothetical protein n=1 Tax=Desulfofarcimen acetoxidans TaxID=58138 RepID=UPI00019E59D6|nr:hypothetical protein [Desulfofarcimen acetoxidans]
MLEGKAHEQFLWGGAGNGSELIPRQSFTRQVFFKCTKSLLRLQKEFQSISYDLMISHTTIVFTRYIMLSWQQRCSTDDRIFGGLFYKLCDKIKDLDWVIALQQLLKLTNDVIKIPIGKSQT